MPEPAPRNKLELIDLGEWAASSDPSSSRSSTKDNLARLTAPVPVEGGVEDGALPMSAGTSWPPINRPARVAQPSDEGVGEADAGWASRGPRFAQFAAAMEADPASQDQLFPRSQRRIRTADPVISSPRLRWLGIGSWALFCAALFVSLLLRPDRVSFQLDQIQPRAVVSDVRPMADSMPATTRFLPAHGQEVAATAPETAPDLDARPADQGQSRE